MFDDPRVVTAIISASVSLLVAGVSGIYVILRAKSEIELAKRKIVADAHANRFTDEAAVYRKEYDRYASHKLQIDASIQAAGENADGTQLAQLIFDFFGTSAKFYRDNKQFLQSSQLDSDFAKVQTLIDGGTLNDHGNPERITNMRTACETSIEIFEMLHARSVGS